MPLNPEPTETEKLITAAFSKRADVAREVAALQKLEAKILALGKGKHSGIEPGHAVTVVAGTFASVGAVSYGLPEGAEDKARKLAGEEFKSLFDHRVIHTPCEAFNVVAGKLLTPAKARDLVQLCLVPGKTLSAKRSYILWPK